MKKKESSPEKSEIDRRKFFEKLIATSVYVPAAILTFKGRKAEAISP